MIKPGYFGKTVPADTRRIDFDFQNEQILYLHRNVDVLFIGDSITQLWDSNAYFNTHCFLVNRGIGGDSSEYLLRRFDADCIQLCPRRAVLMIGTNDIARSDYDFWWRKPGESEQDVLEAYQKNVSEMVAKCDAAGIELTICAVPPSDIAPPMDKEKRWRMTAAMNTFLRSLSKSYVDYASVLSNDGKTLDSKWTPDGIHMNAAGYQRMAEMLKTQINLLRSEVEKSEAF